MIILVINFVREPRLVIVSRKIMLSSNYNTGFIVVLHRTVLEALSDITIAEFRQILTSCEPFVLVHWLFPESLGHLGYIIFVPLKFVVRFFSPELLLSITTFA